MSVQHNQTQMSHHHTWLWAKTCCAAANILGREYYLGEAFGACFAIAMMTITMMMLIRMMIMWFIMVMVIPIIGSHTTIYYPPVEAPAASGRIVATLLTAYERWTRFHGFDPTAEGQRGSRVIMAGAHRVVVPEGMHAYLQTRGEMVPADMWPDVPGLLPTIHRAGTGARTILVLNFHYAVVTEKE